MLAPFEEYLMISFNILSSLMLISLASNGHVILSGYNEFFDEDVLVRINKISGGIKAFSKKEERSFAMIKNDFFIDDSVERAIIEKGFKPLSLDGKKDIFKKKYKIRLGVCPCCSGVETLTVNEYTIDHYLDGGRNKSEDFDKEYRQELDCMLISFIAQEIMVRISIYGKCTLPVDDKSLFAMDLALELNMIPFHVFEAPENDCFFLLSTRDDALIGGHIDTSTMKKIDIKEKLAKKGLATFTLEKMILASTRKKIKTCNTLEYKKG
jgi:hypothetical protein